MAGLVLVQQKRFIKASFACGAAFTAVVSLVLLSAQSSAQPAALSASARTERARAAALKLRGGTQDPFAIRPGVASCNLPSNGSCSEYPSPTEATRKGCELFKGSWATTACPRQNVVAACVMKAGDTNLLYAGGPMGLSRKNAGVMCPQNLGALVLAPESTSPETTPSVRAEAAAELPVVEPELEVTAKTLGEMATALNAACPKTFCTRDHQFIFTNLTCDKTARWCQLELTALQRTTHQTFVATLPFTPAARTQSAFDKAVAAAVATFEQAPRSGLLAATVMTEKRIVAPLAASPAAPVTSTVAAAPRNTTSPARVKAAPAPTQRANKNMAD